MATLDDLVKPVQEHQGLLTAHNENPNDSDVRDVVQNLLPDYMDGISDEDPANRDLAREAAAIRGVNFVSADGHVLDKYLKDAVSHSTNRLSDYTERNWNSIISSLDKDQLRAYALGMKAVDIKGYDGFAELHKDYQQSYQLFRASRQGDEEASQKILEQVAEVAEKAQVFNGAISYHLRADPNAANAFFAGMLKAKQEAVDEAIKKVDLRKYSKDTLSASSDNEKKANYFRLAQTATSK